MHFFHRGQPCPQTITQCFDARVFYIHFFFGDAERFAHTDDLMCRQCTRAHPALMAAAVHLRFQTHARFATHVQRADAFRTIGFVRGKAHQIDFELLQIDLNFTGRLCRIDVEKYTAFAADFADGFNILHHADFVVHHHHRNQNGVRTNRGFEHFQINQTIFQHVHIRDLKTFALQFARGVENRFMLGFHRDNVFATILIKLGNAFKREVIRLGCARGEHDFARISVDQCRDLAARLLHRFFRFPTIRVRTRRRVTKMLGDIRNHFLRHTRINRCGRRIIHINRHVFRAHKILLLVCIVLNLCVCIGALGLDHGAL